MKTVIISGGGIDRDFALSFLENYNYDVIIGVDNGLKFLSDNKIRPDYIVGDFDTADPSLVEFFEKQKMIITRRLNPVKDCTDTQSALELSLEIGSGEIAVLGATGTRLDHVISNIHSLMIPLKAGVPSVIMDKNNRIRLIDGSFRLKKEEQYGRYVSFLPFTEEVTGVTMKGFKYPLEDYNFAITESAGRGVSNEITADSGEISVESGIFILIESKD